MRTLRVRSSTAQLRLGDDLRALALISLGIAKVFAFQVNDAGRHLEQGIALARRIGAAVPRTHRPGTPVGTWRPFTTHVTTHGAPAHHSMP